MYDNLRILAEYGEAMGSGDTGAVFDDVPPSGDPMTINGTAIRRFREGLIAGHRGWSHAGGHRAHPLIG